MGDRGNIAIKQSNGDQIWLYSHWGGYELPKQLQDGIKSGRGRWDDDCYLTKILIGHAVPKDNWKEETGYGISGTIQDNEHDILGVDIAKQTIFAIPERALKNHKLPDDYTPETGRHWTFQEYANLAEPPEI